MGGGVGFDGKDVVSFMNLGWQHGGFFVSSIVLALNSNIYKFLIGSEQGADILVSVYKVMSIFVVSDILSSAIKNNLLSNRKDMFIRFSYIPIALLVSFFTVGFCVLLIVSLYLFDVFDAEEVSPKLIGILAASKIFDSLKGYIKTQFYVARAHVVYMYSSLLLIPFIIFFSNMYASGSMGYEWLVFSLSASSFLVFLVSTIRVSSVKAH